MQHEMSAEQRQPDAIIAVDRQLSEGEAEQLRKHVKRHGLIDLPFGAKVRVPE